MPYVWLAGLIYFGMHDRLGAIFLLNLSCILAYRVWGPVRDLVSGLFGMAAWAAWSYRQEGGPQYLAELAVLMMDRPTTPALVFESSS